MVVTFVSTIARVHNLCFRKVLLDAVQTVGTGHGVTLCVCLLNLSAAALGTFAVMFVYVFSDCL
jgi:hypothetical protein